MEHLLKGNNFYRGNCPYCGGINTFTVRKHNNNLLWNCYRVSCGKKGRERTSLSVEDVIPRKVNTVKSFILPESFIDPDERCFSLLNRYNCLDLIDKSTIRLDVKQDRLVFLIRRGKDYVGATGRKLSDGSNGPKWYNYNNSQCYVASLVSQRMRMGRQGALVEDCFSAVRLSRWMDGVALLGTNISDLTKQEICGTYDLVYIFLDPDATAKAVKLQKELNNYVDTRIVMGRDDPKYLTDVEIQECLNKHGD